MNKTIQRLHDASRGKVWLRQNGEEFKTTHEQPENIDAWLEFVYRISTYKQIASAPGVLRALVGLGTLSDVLAVAQQEAHDTQEAMTAWRAKTGRSSVALDVPEYTMLEIQAEFELELVRATLIEPSIAELTEGDVTLEDALGPFVTPLADAIGAKCGFSKLAQAGQALTKAEGEVSEKAAKTFRKDKAARN